MNQKLELWIWEVLKQISPYAVRNILIICKKPQGSVVKDNTIWKKNNYCHAHFTIGGVNKGRLVTFKYYSILIKKIKSTYYLIEKVLERCALFYWKCMDLRQSKCMYMSWTDHWDGMSILSKWILKLYSHWIVIEAKYSRDRIFKEISISTSFPVIFTKI